MLGDTAASSPASAEPLPSRWECSSCHAMGGCGLDGMPAPLAVLVLQSKEPSFCAQTHNTCCPGLGNQKRGRWQYRLPKICCATRWQPQSGLLGQ